MKETQPAKLISLEAPLIQRGVLFSDHDLDKNSVVVIGDVHGCAEALRELLSQITHTQCQVVFVGDLIDRGDAGSEVLAIVRELCEHPQSAGLSAVTCLMGNHEMMILNAYCGIEFDLWLENGGNINDYLYLSQTHGWGWLNGLPLFYQHPSPVLWQEETRMLLVTHGSVQPGVPLEQQNRLDLVWGRRIQGYSRQHITVHGHTICEEGTPLVFDTPTGEVLRLDTGSFATGIVTGVAFRGVDS